MGQTGLHHGGWKTFHNIFQSSTQGEGHLYVLRNNRDVLVERFHPKFPPTAGSSCINRSDQGPHNREEPTFLLLPQVFHDDKGQHGSGHQSSQDPQDDAHHVVVADPHHRANVVDLPVDGDLRNRAQQTHSEYHYHCINIRCCCPKEKREMNY